MRLLDQLVRIDQYGNKCCKSAMSLIQCTAITRGNRIVRAENVPLRQ
jgi:hypothetical protein